VLYKERSIHLGQYSGPPFFWDFGPGPLSRIAGAAGHECVINLGDVQLFVGPEDFYQFDGSYVSRIPNRLRTWFFNRVNRSRLKDIIGRYDSQNDIAFWHYPSTSAAAGVLDEWVAYALQTGKWTRGALNVEHVLSPDLRLSQDALTYQRLQGHHDALAVPAIAIDGLWQPAVGYAVTPMTAEHIPAIPYNSPMLHGVLQSVPSLFKTDHKLWNYSGSPNSGYLVCQVADPNYFTLLSQARPTFAKWPTDASGQRGTGTLTPTFQQSPGLPIPDTDTDGLATSNSEISTLQDDGGFYFLQNARKHQLRMEFTADCELTAVAYDLVLAGLV